jgi:hypothetical protein
MLQSHADTQKNHSKVGKPGVAGERGVRENRDGRSRGDCHVISGLHRKEINVSSTIFPQSPPSPLQPHEAFSLFPASELNLMQHEHSSGRGASKTTAKRNTEFMGGVALQQSSLVARTQ